MKGLYRHAGQSARKRRGPDPPAGLPLLRPPAREGHRGPPPGSGAKCTGRISTDAGSTWAFNGRRRDRSPSDRSSPTSARRAGGAVAGAGAPSARVCGRRSAGPPAVAQSMNPPAARQLDLDPANRGTADMPLDPYRHKRRRSRRVRRLALVLLCSPRRVFDLPALQFASPEVEGCLPQLAPAAELADRQPAAPLFPDDPPPPSLMPPVALLAPNGAYRLGHACSPSRMAESSAVEQLLSRWAWPDGYHYSICCPRISHTQAAVRGDPGADSTAAVASGGAAMTPTTDETAGGRGPNGDGLPGSTVDAFAEGILGSITAPSREDAPFQEPRECLLVSGSVIESLRRPGTAVGCTSYGKSR